VKLVALEEHYCPPEVRAAWTALGPDLQDDSVSFFNNGEIEMRLEDQTVNRLKHMDEIGVDVQVLSLTTPATQVLEPKQAVELAELSNNLAATTISANPNRFEGFATLPTPDPRQAVVELHRCVRDLGFKGALLTGRTREKNLDHRDFLPIFDAAAELQVPMYIHPQIPQEAVRRAYYSGFGDDLNAFFATGGWGWHAETAVQVLRLILSGLFDKHPTLQLILGHWGEILIFYVERINELSRLTSRSLKKPIIEYVRENLYITPSGIFSQNYLKQAIDVMGIDRIMFSTDYPFQFAPDGGARRFLMESSLRHEDKLKVAHQNWERLTKVTVS